MDNRFKNLKPVKGDNDKYGYIDSYHKNTLNWCLREKKIDFEYPSFNLKPIYDEAYDFLNEYAIVKLNGKWGVIDKNGYFVVNAQYEKINVYRKEGNDVYYRVMLEGKWGVVNEEGEYIVECKYDTISNKFYGNVATISISSKIGFINKNLQVIIEPKFDSVKNINIELLIVTIGNNVGLFNGSKEHFVFDPQFDFIDQYHYWPMMRVKKHNKWGFVSSNGTIIDPQYEEADNFRLDIAQVKINNRWGLINNEGKFVLNPQPHKMKIIICYDNKKSYKCHECGRYCFHDCRGFARIEIGEKSCYYLKSTGRILDDINIEDFSSIVRFTDNGLIGYIDSNMNILFEPQFEEADRYCGGYTKVKIKGKFGLINKHFSLRRDHKFVIEPIYDDILIDTYHDFLIRVRLDDKIGFYNLIDKIVISPQYDELEEFNFDGVAKMKMGNNWGYINSDGRVVVKPEYGADEVFFTGCRFIAIKKGAKWGVVDSRTGITVINPILDEIGNYQMGMIKLRIGKKWGFIDDECNVTLPCFDYIAEDSFREMAIRVMNDGKWGAVYRWGKILVEPRFDEIGSFHHGLAKVKTGDKWGFINKKGEVQIEIQFYTVSDFDKEREGLAMVNLGGEDYYINLLGKRVKDPKIYPLHRYSSYHGYYGSAQESAREGWDMIAGDAGVDGDYDVDSLCEFLGID
ncbi:MAG: WG repeat-containing protein [Bacteroidales bacterium]|nr:WG repeat-containing protein [Bacteroidales bacterium]